MASAVVTAASPSSSSEKFCFNSVCKELIPERPRKGWALYSGQFAELCDRCGCAYEEGRFCETFHLNATGWRCCESCGKRVHCGCIVSSAGFMLLDHGGIKCMVCSRKNSIMPPHQMWPPSVFFHSSFPDRMKDLSAQNWSQLTGSRPLPWQQAPSPFNSSFTGPEMHSRTPYKVDMATGINKLTSGEKICSPPLERRKGEDFSMIFLNGNLKHCLGDISESENAGIKREEQFIWWSNPTQHSISLKEDPSIPPFGLNIPDVSRNDKSYQNGVSKTHLGPTHPPPLANQLSSIHSGLQHESKSPNEKNVCNGRSRAGQRGRNYLLPQYWPRFTDQELQEISADSKSMITPLFEKMLSASDARRIGRLVLPKKCAETYFPSITEPEGLPLKILDAKGKEWIVQFRFWPNSNSRMYVLEGVTPCLQAMQLQAGDVVTFSRLEPDGNLVMGFRKATTTPDQVESTDTSSWTKAGESGSLAKEILGAKSTVARRRTNSMLGLKSKQRKTESEDVIELKLTWEEAQGLLRPPSNNVQSVVEIESFEFEEYEDAPIIGRPTIITSDNICEKNQWTQCEDCLKWRKLPISFILPFRWTCSDNGWDPERSICSAAQELTMEQLEEMLSPSNSASKKVKTRKREPDRGEALEGPDTLTHLAISADGESVLASSQGPTKHPHHILGCSCLLCIQPPGRKGTKHKQTCMCNTCLMVKRQFSTLRMRHERNQTEREAEAASQKQQQSAPDMDDGDSGKLVEKEINGCSDGDLNIKTSTSPFKRKMDLNIQPEREDELSPGSNSGNVMKWLQDAVKKDLRQLKATGCDGITSNNSSEPNEVYLRRKIIVKDLPATFVTMPTSM